jgi:hypothetical protein
VCHRISKEGKEEKKVTPDKTKEERIISELQRSQGDDHEAKNPSRRREEY